MKGYRIYKGICNKGVKGNKLISWMVRKCKICGKFMRKYSKGKYCRRCARIIYRNIDTQIRSYSKKSFREAIKPFKVSRYLERVLGSAYFR